MSIKSDVLAFIEKNAPRRQDLRSVTEGINYGEGSAVSVALFELSRDGRVDREKKNKAGERGFWYFARSATGARVPPVVNAARKVQKAAPARPIARAVETTPEAAIASQQPEEAAHRPKPASKGNGAEPNLYFAIRSDGELGISQKKNGKDVNVVLPSAQVKRLVDFLEVTGPLWGG